MNLFGNLGQWHTNASPWVLITGQTVGWPPQKYRNKTMIPHLAIQKCLSHIINLQSWYLMVYNLYKHSHLAQRQIKTNTGTKVNPHSEPNPLKAKQRSGSVFGGVCQILTLINRKHTCLSSSGPVRHVESPSEQSAKCRSSGKLPVERENLPPKQSTPKQSQQ